MNLQQFKSWKLLYEDQDLCFSKAEMASDKIDVFFITFFKPENLSKATRLMLESNLANYVGLIEDDGKLHLVIKEQSGHPIKKFIKKSSLDYDDRVQVAYSYLKHIVQYDVFPDAIKIQLIDDEQCLINDEGIAFRELVDYTLSMKYSVKDIFKQVGVTLDFILHDSEGHQSQFIDNLILGKHTYDTLDDLRMSFKDIFIYEKPEAIESINSEYTIILNDFEAGPPLDIPVELPSKKSNETPEFPIESQVAQTPNRIESDDLFHEDLQRELASLLIEPLADKETIDESNNPGLEVKDEADDIVQTVEIDHAEQTPLVEAASHTKSFKAIFDEDDQLPEALPKSGKQRYIDEDADLFDEDMSQIFDEEPEEDYGRQGLPRWLILAVVAILIVSLAFFGIGRLFASEPVSAKFVIEPLRDDRIAFMNTSAGEKSIEAYSWEIYYADTLVQTFNDKNLFPVFDTEGDYKIVLKVKDKNGEWSEPYSEIYEYRAKEQ